MTAQLFLTYLGFVVVAVIGISAVYLPRRTTFAIIAGLALWLVYVGLFSSLGYMRDVSLRPPGIVWIVGPVVLFVVLVLVRSSIGASVAAAIPLWLILGFGSFRIGVELLMHRLWEDGLVPKLLTTAGGNVDMFIGLSAPIIAWIATRGRLGLRLAMGWNVLGPAVSHQRRGKCRAHRPLEADQHGGAERGNGDVSLRLHPRLLRPSCRHASRSRDPRHRSPELR